jgi:RNA-directed DNA polymerase
MHAPIAQVGEWLRSVLRGYYQYHAVPGNLAILSRFRHPVVRLWYRTLCQRSPRRPPWKKLGPIFPHWLPIPRVVHAYPAARFDARFRQESPPR